MIVEVKGLPFYEKDSAANFIHHGNVLCYILAVPLSSESGYMPLNEPFSYVIARSVLLICIFSKI